MRIHDSVRVWPPLWSFSHSEFDTSSIDPNNVVVREVTIMPDNTLRLIGTYEHYNCTGTVNCREGVEINHVAEVLSSALGKTAYEVGNLEV